MVKKGKHDRVTVIGCCVTLVEAQKAAIILEGEGTNIRIIDPFTVKPLDASTIISNAKETHGNIITVEDHFVEGM